jgi:SAM-dependent methyltransferase
VALVNKYELYEKSVQSPEEDTELFATIFRNARGRQPHRLREDFCGTFLFASQWVKRDPKNCALALDLDPEPLRHGRRTHFARLKADEKRRIEVLQRDVRSVTNPASDLIVANNFSFFVFRERDDLLTYFRACRRSLRKGGMLILELAGGPGMVEKNREQKTIREMGKPRFKYVWDQRSFNPINREGHYSIHFELRNGKKLKHAFTYHWRIWTIPEVRDALKDAGFHDTHVYWEKTYRGDETGEYIRAEKGDNAWSWLAYVAGLK